jgi:hypothetical protein
MLIENMEKILNNIFGERFEFKAIRRKFIDEDLPKELSAGAIRPFLS